MNILLAIKWLAGLGIVFAIGWGIKSVYNYHLNEIDEAVAQTRLIVAQDAQEAIRIREEFLRGESEKDLAEANKKLKAERAKVNDLRRMLLIDHDLDRLLQRKPGLILPRVNEGTQEVLKELEEATQ